MKMRTLVNGGRAAGTVLIAACLSAGLLRAQTVALPDRYRVIDLTHTLDASFPYIPVPGVTFPFELEPIATIEEHSVAANAWRIHEHLGTQIDAPNHFVADGAGLHDLTARELLVPAVVIDFRARGRTDRDAELTVEDIRAWESRFGRIPDGACVILYTGWDTKLTDPGAFIGLDEEGVKHFPGIGSEAARFLIEERSIWGVGIDAISIDPGPDEAYRTHQVILGANKWALEALANVRHLPPRGAVLFVGAPKVRDATGGPARVIALAPPAPGFDPGALDGVWESERPERIERADGTAVYLTRRFTFREGTWRIRFTVTSDAGEHEALFSGDFGGTFAIGEYTPLLDAFEARFFFSERTLTPGNEQVAAALDAAGCGTMPWRAGAAQDIHELGCEPFRAYPSSACRAEYDLIRIHGDRLFLGVRPPDGNLCSESRRPISLTELAVIRKR